MNLKTKLSCGIGANDSCMKRGASPREESKPKKSRHVLYTLLAPVTALWKWFKKAFIFFQMWWSRIYTDLLFLKASRPLDLFVLIFGVFSILFGLIGWGWIVYKNHIQ